MSLPLLLWLASISFCGANTTRQSLRLMISKKIRLIISKKIMIKLMIKIN
jgi:hypothetical protein